MCLDKTGTLTDGAISFGELEMVGDQDRSEAEPRSARWPTIRTQRHARALAAAFPPTAGWQRTATVPFSSARKWSGATFDGDGTGTTSWVMGAPEILFTGFTPDDSLRARGRPVELGQRVLLVARSSAPLEDETLPSPSRRWPSSRSRNRSARTPPTRCATSSPRTWACGSSPATTRGPSGAVAGRVGVPKADEPVDARTLPEDQAELADVLDTRTVFGRVTPNQKRAFVHALQEKAHVVAMTGDGVNDALALKDADIGVAMGNGAPATRAVAQIVLLDGRFSQLPAWSPPAGGSSPTSSGSPACSSSRTCTPRRWR